MTIGGGDRTERRPPALGLPGRTRACLFDLDGVLTDSARLHAEVWKQVFDHVLVELAHDQGHPFRPFDAEDDYRAFVDGRTRIDGARTFLASRGIRLPDGQVTDDPSRLTLHGVANCKQQRFLDLVRTQSIQPIPGSMHYVHAVRREGLHTAIVSASENARAIAAGANALHLFDVVVDGRVAATMHLAGKPAPDMYIAAAAMLGIGPEHAAVFEDAVAGVEAGRRGGFGFVVGVARSDNAGELRAHGAHRVVHDLRDLLTGP